MLMLFIIIFKSRYFKNIKYIKLYILLIMLSPFLFEYFDNIIYNIYLYFDLDYYYKYVGGEVTYILTILHSFVFFLGYNRQNNL